MTNQINYPTADTIASAKEIGSDFARASRAIENAEKTGKSWKKVKTKSGYADAVIIREIRDYRGAIQKLPNGKRGQLIIAGKTTVWGQMAIKYAKQEAAETKAFNQLNAVAVEFGLASNWTSKNYDNDLALVSAFRDWMGRQLKKQGCLRDSHTSKQYGKVTSSYFLTLDENKKIRVSDHNIEAAESKGRMCGGWRFGPDIILDLDMILSKRLTWWNRIIVLAAHGRSDSFNF